MGSRSGVLLIGSAGAAASIGCCRHGLAKQREPRPGMIPSTDPERPREWSAANLVFAGGSATVDLNTTRRWSRVPPFADGRREGAARAIVPRPGVTSDALSLATTARTSSRRAVPDELRIMREQVESWKKRGKMDRIVMVNLCSTER